MTLYTCQKCGAPATWANGAILRTCEHKDAPVTAHIKAHATGVSQVAGGKK